MKNSIFFQYNHGQYKQSGRLVKWPSAVLGVYLISLLFEREKNESTNHKQE